MAKTANLFARIEPEIKEEAEKVLDTLGISVSGAINMFYKQIILQQGLPFDVKLPQAKKTNSQTVYSTASQVSAPAYCSDNQATYNAGGTTPASSPEPVASINLKSNRLTSTEEPSDEMLNALMLKVRDSARESTTSAENAIKNMHAGIAVAIAKNRKKRRA